VGVTPAVLAVILAAVWRLLGAAVFLGLRHRQERRLA
jgi:hypothetical protein